MLMPHFQKATIAPPPPTNPVYEHEQFHGAWRIETWRYGQTLLPRDVMLRDQMADGAETLSKGKKKYGKRGVPPPMLSSSTVFDVVLYPNSTWETTSGWVFPAFQHALALRSSPALVAWAFSLTST